MTTDGPEAEQEPEAGDEAAAGAGGEATEVDETAGPQGGLEQGIAEAVEGDGGTMPG